MMKKNIIAMAVAAAVAAPAAAMADTTLYGKIHASYDVWGGDTADNQDYSLSSNSSRIGIKGKEEISDSLSLIYQWETGIDFGGHNAVEGIGDKPRNTFVGFTGGWGTAIAGRHDTPMKKVSRKYDLFGDTVGDSRAILRGNNVSSSTVGFDERTNNTIAYATPNLGGFDAMVAYVSDWNKSGTPAKDDLDNDYDAWSARVGYELAGFMIDAAYEVHNQADTTGQTDEESAYRVGAGYKMGGFKVVGLYQSISDLGFQQGEDVDMWGVGGAYSFGKNTVKAQYYRADEIDGTTDTDADLWAVGYDYKMSKQTSVYAVYGNISNGGAPTEDGYGQYELASKTGHGENASFDATGEDMSAFSVGIVHKF